MSVYIAPRSETRKYHTDVECHILAKANGVKQKDSPPWYYTECKYCAGTVEPSNPSWDHQKALKRAAKER